MMNGEALLGEGGKEPRRDSGVDEVWGGGGVGTREDADLTTGGNSSTTLVHIIKTTEACTRHMGGLKFASNLKCNAFRTGTVSQILLCLLLH